MSMIQLNNVSLTFRIRSGGRIGLKEFLLKGLFRQKTSAHIEVNALKNINLTIGDGQRVGIIGHNGSGKSTLLRLMTGVYPPTSGERIVIGKINTLLDIGLGIEPAANAWDNIAYRSYLEGETPADVKRKEPSIAAFSELGEHMNMPVRYYSSGMYVRFAFSLATAIDPEILLLDEIFGAGDLEFQDKARARMLQLIDKARVLVFVSHDLTTLASLCNRMIWLDHGSIVMDGKPAEVISKYQQRFHHVEMAAA